MSDTFEKYQDSEFIEFDKIGIDPSQEELAKEDFKGKKILNVGCGYGEELELLKPDWTELVLSDKSQTMLDKTQKVTEELKLPNVKFVKCPGEKLPFEDNSFDMIICSHALSEFDDWEQGLKEIVRVVKPDGEFILIDSGN